MEITHLEALQFFADYAQFRKLPAAEVSEWLESYHDNLPRLHDLISERIHKEDEAREKFEKMPFDLWIRSMPDSL